MQICVCGWHYYPGFYETLSKIKERYKIIIIAHRAGNTSGLPCVMIENIGLEWGAYSFFLKHYWDERSGVLFMHDDTDIRLEFFAELSSISHDLAFVFENEQDFQKSYSHGRAFFTSARFLTVLRSQGGIWYDSGNKGFIARGKSWSEKPPDGCLDHNAGIRRFTFQAKEIGLRNPNFSINQPFFSNYIRCGIRGELCRKS